MKKTIFSVLCLLFIWTFIPSVTAEEAAGIQVGNKAPDFEAVTLDGEKVRLSDYKGEKVLLNFWATWCPPCREEMPDLQKFYETQDVAVLAVNLTDTEMSEKHVHAFMDEFEFTFPVLMDNRAEIAKLYRINPIPTSFMIDTDGMIQHKAFGPMDYETMVEQLEKMN